jgi:diguanylate cyclase (GGDEF)-like protein
MTTMPLHHRLLPQPSQLDARKRPIIAAAVSFVVLVCLSLSAEFVWSRWNVRHAQLSEKQTATSNMARALAQHAENAVKVADTVLLGVVERLETDGTGAASLARLRKLLRAAELPMLHGVFVFDSDGRQLLNPQASGVSKVNGAVRDYFQYHREHPGGHPYIGQPVRSLSTGEWIITISHRIDHPDGSFAGVALAAVNLQHFKQFYDSFDIGAQGTIFLALDDGALLVRRAQDETTNRQNIADGPVFRHYRANGPVGTAMLTARADNIERLYSYRHVDGYPLLVAVALSKQEILANWRADTWRNGGALVLVVAALALLGCRLIRQLRIREKLTVQLREAKQALEARNESLVALALHDGLTGLANRRQFDAVLSAEFSRALRGGTSLALVMIDVDYFKPYNDIYGHPGGDDCLRRISDAVGGARQRAGDLAARYGGEELAVLLPRTDLAGAMAVAEKMRAAVKDLHIAHAGNPAGIVTISAGVAAFAPTRGGRAAQDLLAAADEALYAAKSSGRDRVRCTGERRAAQAPTHANAATVQYL